MHRNRYILGDANLRWVKIGDLIWLGQRLADAGRTEISAHAPDVPTAELILMGDLLNHPPSTITALAERTGYAQSRVSTAVAGVVERGWAQTRSDPADGRRTLVFVPERVRREAQEFQGNSEARTLDRLLAGLPASRRKTIIHALDELLEVLRHQAEEDRPGTSSALHRALSSTSHPDPASPHRPGLLATGGDVETRRGRALTERRLHN
jgi:MarR family transcriptional regulator, 2-MHQ and catechol-resistance regulon repressor